MNAENKHKNNLQEKDLKQNDRISIRLNLLVFGSPGKRSSNAKIKRTGYRTVVTCERSVEGGGGGGGGRLGRGVGGEGGGGSKTEENHRRNQNRQTVEI